MRTNAERQKEFRKNHAGTHKKLEILLPNNEFNLLHDNAINQGLTKAQYVINLLQGNKALPDNTTNKQKLKAKVLSKSSQDYDGSERLAKALAKLIGFGEGDKTKAGKVMAKIKSDLSIEGMVRTLSTKDKIQRFEHVQANLSEYKKLFGKRTPT
jgi:hypothetical protein